MQNYVCISGCTASGKSALALEISQQLKNSIIINADALQVYNCWNILTDRPNIQSFKNLFLYGHVSMEKIYSVGDWLKDVEKILLKNSNKDTTFIFVGGTGLYFYSLLNGLSQIPEIDTKIRNKAIERSDTTDFFVDELKKKDPATLVTIDKKNIRRLQRAWEVVEQTGKGISYWKDKNSIPLVEKRKAKLIILEASKEHLNISIANRVKLMFERGVIEEVRALHENNWDHNLPFSSAIGAREIINYIEKKGALSELHAEICIKTRQFAKRQRTWQKKYMFDWIKLDSKDGNRQNATNIMKEIQL
jgi:tRNA dimethylallyltransferase